MRRIAIGLALLLALLSCQKSEDDEDKVIASVYDEVLRQSDLQAVIYDDISRSDSIVRAKAFIDKWIRQQLLLHQAEESFEKSELEFSKQVEDYRNSLIIYKFETTYIEKNLDTVISANEISKFIEDNKLTYELDNAAIRYIILNTRKKALIDKMNKDLYNKAVKDKVFVIY